MRVVWGTSLAQIWDDMPKGDLCQPRECKNRRLRNLGISIQKENIELVKLVSRESVVL